MSHEKIVITSRFLKRAVLTLIITLPVLNGAFWILNGFSKSPIDLQLVPSFEAVTIPPLSTLSPFVKFLGFLTNFIPIGFAIIALLLLGKLFSFFERLVIFSSETVRLLRNIGWVVIASQLAYPIYCALISLVLTLSNPPGQRCLCISFGLNQFALIALSLVILVFAWIMEEGKGLKDEQDATI